LKLLKEDKKEIIDILLEKIKNETERGSKIKMDKVQSAM
jgi:hypothetical protein